jgi:hypothetical protein
VPPDPGCYEERYKVAGAALRLAFGLLALGVLAAVLGSVRHAQLITAMSAIRENSGAGEVFCLARGNRVLDDRPHAGFASSCPLWP